jgi:tellurite methyltransferase
METTNKLQELFGGIDIYLFDQLLKGRIAPPMKVLDAGCGSGRNLVYLLRSGFDVCAVDGSPSAIEHVKQMAGEITGEFSDDHFKVGHVEKLSWPDETFDLVISSAVLHFADHEEQWHAMVNEMWRVLKPEGLFFARLASTIGIESLVQPIRGRRYVLPDSTERFLVDEKMLLEVSDLIGGQLFEPLKTTVVQNLRSMTTWCLRKMSSSHHVPEQL